ncbi:MAG TPA: hypothetical protein VMY16_13090 [Ilumatobacteraceae bacterium]|nr:hypothetical protein [Ilumatobacteraceae bacterium]HUV19604.1 hypothetical protein [Ilumatobacteraceae bacterium]
MSNNTSKNASTKQSSRASSGGDIVVRATPRPEPDLRRLARALIELAQQEISRESEAQEATCDIDQSAETTNDDEAAAA